MIWKGGELQTGFHHSATSSISSSSSSTRGGGSTATSTINEQGIADLPLDASWDIMTK